MHERVLCEVGSGLVCRQGPSKEDQHDILRIQKYIEDPICDTELIWLRSKKLEDYQHSQRSS